MLWLLVALQSMTLFIHAHAGAVQLNHGGLLHVSQSVQGDAAYQVMAGGAEIAAAQGMPLRKSALCSRCPVCSDADAVACYAADAPLAVRLTLPRADTTGRLGADLPSPHLALPDYTLPHALAPPFA